MSKWLAVMVCLVLTGCAHGRIYQAHMDLDFSTTKQEVLKTMGPPAQTKVYKRPDDTIMECLFYKHFQPYEGTTPLCFVDNKIIGWSHTFYQDHVGNRDIRLK